jgi:hypothetical protein
MDRLLRAMADAAARLDRRPGPPDRPVSAGDLFVFPTEQAALEWLVVRPHPDDPDLVFLVPADDCPLAGPGDVELPPDLVERPLVVRCDQGLWLSARQLPLGSRVDSLPEPAVRLVRCKVAELARGRVEASDRQLQIDCDPEYERWLARVEACRERLPGLLPLPLDPARPTAVSLKKAGTILPFPGPDRAGAAAPQYAQAAAPAWQWSPGASAPAEIQGVWLAFPCPGRLFLAEEDAAVGVRYLAAAGEEPPALAQIGLDGAAVPAAWSHTPDRSVWWAGVALVQGRAALRLGSGEQAREIHVEP